MKQARSEASKGAKAKRREIAAELQLAREFRREERVLLRELAEMGRSHLRWAVRFKAEVQPEQPATRTSPVTKRLISAPLNATPSRIDGPHAASSWVIDDFGMRGVIWQQSYLGRNSPSFHPGAARENWDYVARDEAVLLDATGEPIILSNMGDDWIEIGAAWAVMEDATTRKNGKIQILAIAPFDADMSQEEMVAALRTFCETILEPLGLPYAAVMHRPPEQGDQRNFHPHILFSLRPMRRIEPFCWEVADEVRGELDGRDGVQTLRHLWAYSMTEAATAAQRNMRYTGLGYGARALDLEAGEHLGEARAAMVQRGARVWAHDRNRIKNARNAARRTIRDADRKIAALTKVRDAALARIAAGQSGAVKTRILSAATNPAGIGPLKPAASRVDGDGIRIASTLPMTVDVAPLIPSRPPQAARARLRSSTSVTGNTTRNNPVTVLRPANQLPDNAGPMLAVSDRPASAARRLVASVRPIKETRLVASAGADAVAPNRPRLVAARNAAAPKTRLSPASPASPAPGTRLVAAASREATFTLHSVGVGRQASGNRPDVRQLTAAYHQAAPVPRLVPAPKVPDPKPPLVSASRVSPDTTMKALLEALLLALSMARTRKAKKREVSDAVVEHLSDHGRDTEDAPPLSEPSSVPEPSPGAAAPSAPATRPTDLPRRMIRPPGGSRLHPRMAPGNIRLSLPTINETPSRAWLEANPLMRAPAPASPDTMSDEDRSKIDRLVQADAYVTLFGDGMLEIDGDAMKALGLDPRWVSKPDIQRALAPVRADQQTVLTVLSKVAKSRPLAFKRSGERFWPRDLDPVHLRRLDGWSADPGFQQDIMPLELVIENAHLEHEKARRLERDAATRSFTPKPAGRIPDGFGGWRDTPAPRFDDHEPFARVDAFDPATGRPSDRLLMLLKLAGEHPRKIDVATDGRLMALPGFPPAITSLLHGWRKDERVAALVMATVRASRASGEPTWPDEIASAVRAYARRGMGFGKVGPAPDRSDGPSR